MKAFTALFAVLAALAVFAPHAGAAWMIHEGSTLNWVGGARYLAQSTMVVHDDQTLGWQLQMVRESDGEIASTDLITLDAEKARAFLAHLETGLAWARESSEKDITTRTDIATVVENVRLWFLAKGAGEYCYVQTRFMGEGETASQPYGYMGVTHGGTVFVNFPYGYGPEGQRLEAVVERLREALGADLSDSTQ
jgi:hypothetical protein